MATTSEDAHVRIGELARRLGVSPDLLRAWERRYGLLTPLRTASGYRLYSPADEQRVRAMLRLIKAGVSAQQAASTVLAPPPASPQTPDREDASTATELGVFAAALARFDEAAANAVFDRVLARYAVGTVMSAVVLPCLVEIGERWSRGDATIAQEHFASNLIRGRLLGLARGWDAGAGPRAVLACPSDELHDLGLITFGIALRAQGWRITYLGADTPRESLTETVTTLEPHVVVLAATDESRFNGFDKALSRATRIAIGGRGATPELAERLDAELLADDVLAAAAQIANHLGTGAGIGLPARPKAAP